MDQYIADEITVNSNWTELNPLFDIYNFAIYPVNGNILFQISFGTTYGDSIKGYSEVPIEECLDCRKIRIKAVSGNVLVSYYICGRGQ